MGSGPSSRRRVSQYLLGRTKSTSLVGRKFNIGVRPGRHRRRRYGRDGPDAVRHGPDRRLDEVEPTFDVEHVASTIVYMSNLPLDTNVQFVTIMVTDMPYIGRGSRVSRLCDVGLMDRSGTLAAEAVRCGNIETVRRHPDIMGR